MAEDIRGKITDICVEKLGVKMTQIVPEARFVEDLGADSLDHVELIMAFEDEFSLEIPDDEAEKFRTVQDITEYVEKKLK